LAPSAFRETEDDALLRRMRRLLAAIASQLGPKRPSGAAREQVLVLAAELEQQLAVMRARAADLEQRLAAVSRQINATAAYARSAGITSNARGRHGRGR
jgi:hypothetical protein